MRDIQYHIQQLREEGLTIIPDVFTKDQCNEYIKHAWDVVNRFIANGSKLINSENQFIINAFRHDPKFLDFIYHDFLDAILKTLLDEDYVLISTTMTNRRSMKQLESSYQALGGKWHTDSRYLGGGKRLDQGFGYIALITLNDFKKENGATHFVPGSLKFRNKPEREGIDDYIVAEAKAGTMVLFDTGMWHRSGPAGTEDRWAAINYYGPWFMKPYYNFPALIQKELGEEFIQSLTPAQRRLFHFNAIPPINEEERFSTLSKEGEGPFDKPAKREEFATS